MVVVALDVEFSKVRAVCDELVNNPNISSVVTTFGRFNVILFAEFYHINELNQLIRVEMQQNTCQRRTNPVRCFV